MINLTALQQDAFQEVFNIGVGRAASLLNDLIESHLYLEVPQIKILSPQNAILELEKKLHLDTAVSVCLDFSGTLKGKAHLFFPVDSASLLVAKVTGEEPDSLDLDGIKIATITEVGNILINSIVGSISNLLCQQFSYSLPTYAEGKIRSLLIYPEKVESLLFAQTSFILSEFDVHGNLTFILEEGFIDMLIKALDTVDGSYGA